MQNPAANSYDPLAPVLLALEKIAVGTDVEFQGVDLETGRQLTVTVGEGQPPCPNAIPLQFAAQGLLLTLCVAPIPADE